MPKTIKTWLTETQNSLNTNTIKVKNTQHRVKI